MPMQGDHACRVMDPGECSEFRRKNGEREHEGKKYDVIYGKKKDGGDWADQSYRYPTESWSASEAREHCRSHDGMFEAAAGGGEGESGQPCIPCMRPLVSPWAMLQELGPVVLARIQSPFGDRSLAYGSMNSALAVYGHDSILPDPPEAGPRLPSPKGSVAVIPIRGVLVQHASDLWYGDTTTDWLDRAITEMANSPNVGAIVLDIDSPGGIVFGTEELASKIRAVREVKPVYAVANSMAASAAYWIGSAASKLFVTPGGQVGSIGVWNMHVDISAMEERFGLKTTLVSAGKFKTEGHPWAPLDEEARGAMQASVDTYYEKFVAGVAANREKRPSEVRAGFGQGRLVLSADAKAEGMVDGIHTLEEVLSALMKAKPASSASRANTVAAGLEIAQAWRP